MLPLLAPALLLVSAGAAEPLSDKIDRDYVQPALQQVQGAFEGREPNWTPPVLPGTAQTAKLSEQVRARWIEPLMNSHQAFALDAAQSLASPHVFEAPAEPDVTALLPDATISPETESLVSAVERRFLSRLFPEDFALRAASALGSGSADEAGPDAPAQDDLASQPLDLESLPSGAGAAATGGPAASERFARRRDFAGKKRRVADSTSLTRGSAGPSAASRARLKPTHSRFTAVP